VLVIDDAGAEHQTPATVGLLHGLLQSRFGQWTVLTTNLCPDTWRQRDERIGSHLIRDRNVYVDSTTADYATRDDALR
jgi:DNA replication protein DnaC